MNLNEHDIIIWRDEYWMYLEDHPTDEQLVLVMTASGDQDWANRADITPVFKPAVALHTQ